MPSFRYWRLRSTVGSEAAGVAAAEIHLTIDGVDTTLLGKTLTNLGGAFDPAFPITNLNDDNVNTLGFVPVANGAFDIYVDMLTAVNVTAVGWAPQNDSFNNTPKNLNIYGSNNATTWTTIATFTNISNPAGWTNHNVYRQFSTTVVAPASTMSSVPFWMKRANTRRR